ncbi:MAG: hypothetical protein R2748_23085 [Bryobacterales bacterium]
MQGKPAAEQQLQSITSDVDAAVAQVNLVQEQVATTIGATANWEQFKVDWAALKKAEDSPTVEQTLRQHAALISRLTELMREVGDRSHLTLSADPDARFLADAAVTHLPSLVHTIGLSEAVAAGATNHEMSPAEAASMTATAGLTGVLDAGQTLNRLLGQIEMDLQALDRDARVAYGRDPALERRIGPALEKTNIAAQSFVDMTFNGAVRGSGQPECRRLCRRRRVGHRFRARSSTPLRSTTSTSPWSAASTVSSAIPLCSLPSRSSC